MHGGPTLCIWLVLCVSVSHVYVYASMWGGLGSCICVCVYMVMHVYVPACMHMCVLICMHAHVYMHVCVHVSLCVYCKHEVLGCCSSSWPPSLPSDHGLLPSLASSS